MDEEFLSNGSQQQTQLTWVLVLSGVFINPSSSCLTAERRRIPRRPLTCEYEYSCMLCFMTFMITWCTSSLTLILLTWTIWRAPTNAIKWRMGFNSAFKGLTFNNCTFSPHCIYVFCIYLRKNSDLCHLYHKLIGFYNRDENCLLRGTNWFFK